MEQSNTNNRPKTFRSRSFNTSSRHPQRRNFRSGGSAQARAPKISGTSIDIRKLVKVAVPQTIAEYKAKHVFNDFDLDAKLKANITKKGYVTPTAIQDQAIPDVLSGVDVVGLADTGTGKTAAFLLPLINKVIKDRKERVLVVAPTRELASQIRQELFDFTDMLRIFSVTCIGGAGIRYQIDGLRRDPHFVVGTPGRLKDLIERGEIKISNFKTIVLDEADQMLDMGFVDDMKYLLSLMPDEKQVLLFSATMSKEIENIIHKFQKNPTRISVKTGDTSENVHQDIVRVNDSKNKIQSGVNFSPNLAINLSWHRSQVCLF